MIILGGISKNNNKGILGKALCSMVKHMPVLQNMPVETLIAEDTFVLQTGKIEHEDLKHKIAYSGQILNLNELGKELSLAQGTEPEEIIYSLFKERGEKFAEYLEGDYILFVQDSFAGISYLYRSLSGLKPVYYYSDKELTLFGSDMRMFFSLRKKTDINARALHVNLLHSSVFSEEQLIDGVFELRPGNYIKIYHGDKNLSLEQFSDHLFRIESNDNYKNKFREIFDDALIKRLPASDETIGLALSGGVDTSIIASRLNMLYNGKVNTYTVILKGDRKSEYQDARKVAEKNSTEHHEIFLNNREAFSYIPKVIWHMGEIQWRPLFLGTSILTYLIGKKASEHNCRKIFTGNGTELILGGNNPQRRMYAAYAFWEKVPDILQNAVALTIPKIIKRPIYRLWSSTDMDLIEKKYIEYNTFWHAEENLKDVYTVSFLNQLKDYSADSILSEYLARTSSFTYFNKLLYLDLKTWNSRRNMVLNERMLRATGTELQIPFLDDRLVKICSSMPLAMKHDHFENKSFLKNLYYDELPESIKKKVKKVSTLRLDFWNGEEWEIVSHFAEKFKKRNIVRDRFIDKCLKRKGNRDIQPLLLCFFATELWMRIFTDSMKIKEDKLTYDQLV